MATFTILIMIGALCLATAQDTDQCPYRYDIQPGPIVRSFNQSLENGTHLTLCCQVSSEGTAVANFSIQWHYSTYPFPSNKSSDIENTIIAPTSQPTMVLTRNNTRLVVWSKLSTHIQKKKDTGFYWCSVKPNDSDTYYPSTVLNISLLEDIQLQTCNCDDGPIVDSTLFSELPCASGNVTEIDPRSDNCQQSDRDEKPLSTNRAEDLMITTPPEINKYNESTTGEGTTGTLMTSPTKLPSSTTMTHTTTVEITNEKAYEDITQTTTNMPDTEGLTTAVTSRRDRLDKIMMSFIIGLATAAILSLIILLCLGIGICFRKLSKTRAKKHRKEQAEHTITISTPVDVYNMITKTKLVRNVSELSSSFVCEPNTSYDTTPGTAAPSLEHVYDCIP